MSQKKGKEGERKERGEGSESGVPHDATQIANSRTVGMAGN